MKNFTRSLLAAALATCLGSTLLASSSSAVPLVPSNQPTIHSAATAIQELMDPFEDRLLDITLVNMPNAQVEESIITLTHLLQAIFNYIGDRTELIHNLADDSDEHDVIEVMDQLASQVYDMAAQISAATASVAALDFPNSSLTTLLNGVHSDYQNALNATENYFNELASLLQLAQLLNAEITALEAHVAAIAPVPATPYNPPNNDTSTLFPEITGGLDGHPFQHLFDHNVGADFSGSY
jgi:hypothetical protein